MRVTEGDFHLIAYDVEKDRRRNRVARILGAFGNRVQKSVFEVRLTGEQKERLRRLLEKAIDSKTDSVRWYRLCANCAKKVEIQGIGVVTELPEAWVI